MRVNFQVFLEHVHPAFLTTSIEDHILRTPDRSLILSRQTSKWSLWDVVFHENNTSSCFTNDKNFTSI